LELAIKKVKELNSKENEIDLSFNDKTNEDSKENLINETKKRPEKEYNLTNWLRQQHSGNYTLQLASVVKRKDIISF
jgi:septal ring-binding cell division protein DamX